MANFQTKTISFGMSGYICSSVTSAKLWKMGAAKLCSKGLPKNQWGLEEVGKEDNLKHKPKTLFLKETVF